MERFEAFYRETLLPDDLSEELLARKVGSYYDIGQTRGPAALLDLLKARCPTNAGEFSATDGD